MDNIKNTIFHNDYVEIHVHDNIDDKIKIIFVDLENYNKVFNISFFGRNRQYVKCNGKILHREITNCEEGFVVDHINGNTFDNRKNNLRIVTQSINQRNLQNFKRNNTGIIGIQYRENGSYKYYRVSWRELNGKRRTRQFNINKYGKDKAFELAKEFLREKYKENGCVINF